MKHNLTLAALVIAGSILGAALHQYLLNKGTVAS